MHIKTSIGFAHTYIGLPSLEESLSRSKEFALISNLRILGRSSVSRKVQM